jgi:hypothetical protein
MSDKAHSNVVWLRVPLDGETAERLRALSDICHNDEITVAASLLHDILKEDADCHELLIAPAPSAAYH